MNPKAFLEKWNISRPQLSILLGYSMTTIDRWCGPTPPEVPGEVLRRLDEIDVNFTRWKDEAIRLAHQRDVFESLDCDDWME